MFKPEQISEQPKSKEEMVAMQIEFYAHNKDGREQKFSAEVKATPDETWENIKERCLEFMRTTYPPAQGWEGHTAKPIEPPEIEKLEVEKPKKKSRDRIFE